MRNWFTLLSIIVCSNAFGQSDEIDIERIINTNSILDDEVTSEEINALLLDILSSPLDLNTVSEEVLSGISFLSNEQIRNFIDYRNQFGPFISKWELQQIEGWDVDVCKMVASVSIVDNKNNGKFLNNFGRNAEFIIRESRLLQERIGFADSINRFEGDRNKLQLRFKSSNPGDYSVSLAVENDPGEKFRFRSGRLGFDHISGNVSLFNRGFIRKIVLGDFRLQFGQGLIFGSSFGGRKSSEPIMSLRKPNTGIIPSSSFSETGFLRGVAVSLGKKGLNLTVFGSRISKDATLRFDSLKSVEFITSFNETGLHRNGKEVKINNTVNEILAGGAIAFRKSKLETGLQYHAGKYSSPVMLDSKPYQLYRFQGRRFHAGGIFLNYGWANYYLFHESAVSNFNGFSTLTGIILALSKNIDLSVLFRHFSPGYQSPYGKGFAETSTLDNETGLYWGLKYHLLKFNISAYFDYFKFPWLKFGVDNPSDGYEYMIRIDYLSKQTPFYLLLKNEKKYAGKELDSEPANIIYSERTNLTANFQFILTEHVSGNIRPAATYSNTKGGKASGVLLKQDLKFEYNPFTLNFGYFLFDTSSFEGRLYSNEPDVRFQSSFPLFNGEGMRYFFLIKIKVRKALNFWIKYYLTSYNNIDEIGSGPDLIKGNKISELKTQIIYSFR